MTTFTISNSGNLIITLDKEGEEFLAEQDEEKKTDEDIFIDLIEYHLCNGYSLVRPEHIGALTDSLLIADGIIDDETTDEQASNINVWYYNYYMVTSYLSDLKSLGYVIWNRA